MKLSIIIPVYNAEKYLYKCLQSIVLQNIKSQDFEVVLINDGSTDKSLKIAESFFGVIDNLRIITQLNQGEAVSRNNALKVSHGEYITFLDSDDYYENNALSTALDIISLNDLDILYLRLKQVDEQGNFRGFVYDLMNEGAVSFGLLYDRRPFPATVYRKKIIGDITFPHGILVGPDSVFNALVQSRADRVSFTKKAIYNYTYRADSLSKQGYTEKAFHGFMTAIRELQTCQAMNISENDAAIPYFENMYTVFVTRVLELNIIPEWNRGNYDELLNVLEELNLMYILDRLSDKYLYVASSFRKFKAYQQYLRFKSTIHQLLYRA